MNVLEKAEKALEFLKANEQTAKSHELQAAAGTLGRCLGALGSRSSYARHYANLLHTALPTLLFLAGNDSAEVRLAGDEALNRAVVGGFAFHSHKTNNILQNQIDHTKNARWIRAALSRICLGDCWLRPGVGKIRMQAQTLFPKLSQIVRQTTEIQLIVEALESNLPRILDALAEYTTDEEMADLSKALLTHVETSEPAVRRGISTCVAHLCSHRETLITNLLACVFDKLWPLTSESNTVLGWFCVIKAIFQLNDVNKYVESELFTVNDYLELYHLSLIYLEHTTEHNIQNCVMESLSCLLFCANAQFKRALLDKHPSHVCLDERERRSHNAAPTIIPSRFAPSPSSEARDPLELSFSGALQLGSVLRLNTPSLSCEDLSIQDIQTPDTPESEAELDLPNTEQLSKHLTEKLKEFEETDQKDTDQVDQTQSTGIKVNIGTATDDDVTLKYCTRLLVSKFLLTGNKGGVISDRSIRVSVKSSALNCLSEILKMYPQVMTMYLDKDEDLKNHNISGSSEESNQDNANEFVLERNVCYQDSLSESLSQDMLKSVDSQTPSQKQKLEKSSDSELKTSKEIHSGILDSKIYAKSDLIASAMSQDSTNIMTNSNFTSNSNMTESNDQTTGYPMSSSGDILTSSIDLDMKFDHFGESTTNLDNLAKDFTVKKVSENKVVIENVEVKMDDSCLKEYECQHVSDVFVLLNGHSDPQIRGLVRVCVGHYLVTALDLSHGDYNRWRCLCLLPKDVSDCLTVEYLVDVLIKGLTDEIHSTVTHTLTSLSTLAPSLSNSSHWSLLVDILNGLVCVENNAYWLCKVNLCRFYEKMPYQRLFMLYPDYHKRSKRIMDTLIRLLADQDQKVRNAASQTISSIIPKIYPMKTSTPTTMLTRVAFEQTQLLNMNSNKSSLELVRNLHFYNDIPEQMKDGSRVYDEQSLQIIVADLMQKLMSSNCKYFSQGIIETLQRITSDWSVWMHIDAFTDQGVLAYCLQLFDCCSTSVACRTNVMDVCRMVYPVEIHKIMRLKTSNRDIFERDTQTIERWQHLNDEKVAGLAEKFLQVTLKMLNLLVHLIEEVNPNIHLNKSGIALPGSPVRRKTQEPIQRKGSITSETGDDKNPLRKKPMSPATSLKANFSGHFYNEPNYMKLYDNLRATYSNHKINLDSKGSVFYTFLRTTLNCLIVQLELATEKELGSVTEEILYYLKALMPYCPDLSVHCVTQLLKCLFGTNMINQYTDYMNVAEKFPPKEKLKFFEDILLVNSLAPKTIEEESRRSSVSSNASQRLSMDAKCPKMAAEKQLLIAMENFAKNKSDRKWSTNKKELERYIRLFEPVVIQSLKSYTMQNDIPLQCQVLKLLNQLLTLRVNYCMLDSDQIFIGFLMKQLDLIEQHEIPNCCDLVNGILTFLVQLSSSKHHTKQLIEIPKLIQLCDGLMASGAHAECTAGLEPVAVKVFSNMGGNSVLGRAQQQEAQATREVLFYMLQKTMHQEKVLNLVSCVLCLSQDHPEGYYRWSELAADTVLSLLAARSIELETVGCAGALERLLQCICAEALTEQGRMESLVKILFQAPPDTTSPYKQRLRYLTSTLVLLKKYLVLIPESEILLTINYMKATCISPQSIFFNVKQDIDPLNVQNVNENCANLSPDVILVRFLFKTLTYVILELESCYEDVNLDVNDMSDKGQSSRAMYAVCVNFIVLVKHLIDGSQFPLTSKTSQDLLHNEQSGLNTGLYSPNENIPLEALNRVCLNAAHRMPLLTVHWSHLLIRLNFLTHKYCQKLVGFAGKLPFGSDVGDASLLTVDLLQTACVMAYCEYFVQNGLTEAVHLTWLLVNRIHILVVQAKESIVAALLTEAKQFAPAAALLIQALAARCQQSLRSEFALNTYKILTDFHASQSGALIFLICRILGKLEPSIAIRFSGLAVQRCKLLKEMSFDDLNQQLSKEDVQVALELLQRDKVHVRYSSLVMELNSLASTVFDLSPLDLSQDRAINPQYILTTEVDDKWLLNQVKSRCCVSECSAINVSKHNELARLLSNLSRQELTAVMACPEFDRKLLSSCFKVSCQSFLKEFINIVCVYESKELERDKMKEQKRQMKDDMAASIDSNKMNVVNTLHVFKKSDNKESKSQFFIPINEAENVTSRFGNLEISDEETEIDPPDLSDLYQMSTVTFDKSLTDVIRLFPKQSRPLSQSENFSLNIEQTIDRYTRRCHQVFQDKLFYQEFMTIQTIMKGFLETYNKLVTSLDKVDCDLIDKCIETILPETLRKNIAIFSVISLQYMSFLIKNKSIVECPIPTDVSFRVNVNVTDNVTVDHVIQLTVENVSEALSIKEIWKELNINSNSNRPQSAICCLYAIVKYLVKDTKPLVLKSFLQNHDGPKPEIFLIGDKLVTLVEYWEQNFYVNKLEDVMPKSCKESVEKLIISLSRLDIVNNVALIPPIAWSSMILTSKDEPLKIDLPLQTLQDVDVMESFVFRANLISWSCKKQFEELWVCILGGVQRADHRALRAAVELVRKAEGNTHVARSTGEYAQMQLLRNLLIGTKAYELFDEVNLERVPLMNDGFDGFHTAQYSIDFLKAASDMTDEVSYKIKRELKRRKRNEEIDVNSCLQIMMDITTQMLDPKSGACWHSSAGVVCALWSGSARGAAQWAAAARALAALNTHHRALLAALPTVLALVHPTHHNQLQELSSIHQKLIKSLSSGYAPLRQAALQGCLLQLTTTPVHCQGANTPYNELLAQLTTIVRQSLSNTHKISLYEQSLYWTVAFTLIELGHPELINMAADFLLLNPRHYCADLVVKGITQTLRQQVLPKDLKNSLIEKLLDNTKMYSEHHVVQILMVHLFLADNRLLSPRLTSDVSNMDPDILMNSMERITLLYKVLKTSQYLETKTLITSALKYFLRETLPPAATLSRVVIEFLECCKEAERAREGVMSERERWVNRAVLNAEIVFEVFETSITQDQLPVLSGWIFEAICHLLNGKISTNLLPYAVLTLLTSASSNNNIRTLSPLSFYILRQGFKRTAFVQNMGLFNSYICECSNMTFKDKRLLCIVCLKSNFVRSQLVKLMELCESNESLNDLALCLSV